MRICVLLLLMTVLCDAERFRVHHRLADWLARRLAGKYPALKFEVFDEDGMEVAGEWQFLKYIPAELAALDQDPIEQEVEVKHADASEVKTLLTALEPDTIVEEVTEHQPCASLPLQPP